MSDILIVKKREIINLFFMVLSFERSMKTITALKMQVQEKYCYERLKEEEKVLQIWLTIVLKENSLN